MPDTTTRRELQGLIDKLQARMKKNREALRVTFWGFDVTVGDVAGNLIGVVKAAANMSEKLTERAINDAMKPGVWLLEAARSTSARGMVADNRRRSSAEPRYRPGQGADPLTVSQ